MSARQPAFFRFNGRPPFDLPLQFKTRRDAALLTSSNTVSAQRLGDQQDFRQSCRR
jgi:hypothetical protein